MNTPLDRHASGRTGLVRVARLFSNVVSPPVMFALLGLAIALKEYPFWQGFAWAAVYGFLVSLAPILVVLYLLRTDRISELHMSNTGERHLPYLSAILFSALAYAVITLAGASETLRCLTIFNTIELAALGIINIFWLISIHATGIMASLVLVGLIFGWLPGLLMVLPFVVLVCAVRLYLKRHTPAQVIAGLALGAGSVLVILPFGCF